VAFNAKTGALSQLSVPGCFIRGAIPDIVLALCGQMRAAAPSLPVGMITNPGHLELVRVPSAQRRLVPNGDLGVGDAPAGIGRQWIELEQFDQSGEYTATVDYLNWHTGTRRSFTGVTAPTRDLDSPDLRRLPAQRPIVDQTGIGRAGAALILRQRGRRRHILSSCRHGCYSYRETAGLVTWAEGFTAYGYRVRNRHTYRAHFARPPNAPVGAREGISVTADRYRIYVTVPTSQREPNVYDQIYQTRR